jgi:hypothetical protein
MEKKRKIAVVSEAQKMVLVAWDGVLCCTYEPDEGDAVLPRRVSREQSTRGCLCDDGDACNAG